MPGVACECGKRPANACRSLPMPLSPASASCSFARDNVGTCEKNPALGLREGEIDFTTKA